MHPRRAEIEDLLYVSGVAYFNVAMRASPVYFFVWIVPVARVVRTTSVHTRICRSFVGFWVVPMHCYTKAAALIHHSRSRGGMYRHGRQQRGRCVDHRCVPIRCPYQQVAIFVV